MPLIHRPANEGILRAQIKDIVFVDPRRQDQQRALQHFFSSGRILDQLHQIILINNLARRDGDILAHLELAFIRHADAKIALPTFKVGQQIGQALQQILATRLRRAAQHFWIGHSEIRGAHRIHELAGIKIHLLRGFLIQPFGVMHQALHIAGREQITLPDEVKHFIVAPGFVLEALIFLVFRDHVGRGLTHHAARGVLP